MSHVLLALQYHFSIFIVIQYMLKKKKKKLLEMSKPDFFYSKVEWQNLQLIKRV